MPVSHQDLRLVLPEGLLPLALDGVLYFRDEHHLNVCGSTLMAITMVEKISRKKIDSVLIDNSLSETVIEVRQDGF